MFTRDCISTKEDVEEDGAGTTLADIGQAIMIWALMNERPVSVTECALTFNTTPDIIQDAAKEIYWLLVVPDGETDPAKLFIEVDGD